MPPVPSVTRVVEVFRADAVAAACGLEVGTVTAFASGDTTPPPDVSSVLDDLHALVDDLHAAFTARQAQSWLDGSNAYLGASPRSVLRVTGGIAAVRTALAAHMEGAPD